MVAQSEGHRQFPVEAHRGQVKESGGLSDGEVVRLNEGEHLLAGQRLEALSDGLDARLGESAGGEEELPLLGPDQVLEGEVHRDQERVDEGLKLHHAFEAVELQVLLQGAEEVAEVGGQGAVEQEARALLVLYEDLREGLPESQVQRVQAVLLSLPLYLLPQVLRTEVLVEDLLRNVRVLAGLRTTGGGCVDHCNVHLVILLIICDWE